MLCNFPEKHTKCSIFISSPPPTGNSAPPSLCKFYGNGDRWTVLRRVSPITHHQLFLDNFSLTRSLAQKLVMPAFEKGDLSTKTCPCVPSYNVILKTQDMNQWQDEILDCGISTLFQSHSHSVWGWLWNKVKISQSRRKFRHVIDSYLEFSRWRYSSEYVLSYIF